VSRMKVMQAPNELHRGLVLPIDQPDWGRL
jgi:hypothetical protein